MNLDHTDAAVMDLLFGPRLDLSNPDIAAIVAAEAPSTKGVEWVDGAGLTHAAVKSLLMIIIHAGLSATPIGWSLEGADNKFTLTVHCLQPLAIAA